MEMADRWWFYLFSRGKGDPRSYPEAGKFGGEICRRD